MSPTIFFWWLQFLAVGTAIYGAGGKFKVDIEGNLVKLRNVIYSWPASAGTPGTYLRIGSGGVLTWEAAGGSGTPSDSVTSETTFGISSAAGGASAYSRGDHTHGSPTNPVTGHESTYSHALLHSNANDPTSDQKAALVGTSGTPSVTNKYVTNSDSRNTDAREPTAHALGSVSHATDTLANLNLKISDADVPALAGQLGGTAASPDVRGFRESGGQLLTMGAVADTQYLMRSGTTITSGSPGGGSPPAWKGVVAGNWGDGNPNEAIQMALTSGTIAPTPTNITVSLARCSYFQLDTAITVAKIRWYGVGAVTTIYHIAVYRNSDSARMSGDHEITTAAATWGSVASAFTLAANVLYLGCVSADTTGTTAGMLAFEPTTAATTGKTTIPTAWPGSLDIDAASPKILPLGFSQFAVTAGALPTTAPTRAARTATDVGGMVLLIFDSNGA